jgi:hypothetical protein
MVGTLTERRDRSMEGLECLLLWRYLASDLASKGTGLL